MGWTVGASNMNTSKSDIYTVLDTVFNPLSPKSDQHQISFCNINAL